MAIAVGVVVAGVPVDEGEFVEALRRLDADAEARLVQQLREDFRSRSEYSTALVLVQRAFRGQVIGWLSARFFRGDLELAKEAWNDALFRVWSRIEAYDEKRSRFRTWLWNQARYAALDLFRRPWEGREEPFAGEERSKRDERGRLIGDPLHRALDAEAQRLVEDPEPLLPHEIAALRSAWSRLNEPEQRLLHYRYLVGLEPVEIARRGLAGREIPAEHLRVYVNRAAGRMRRFYEEELAAYFGESGGQEVRQNG